MQRLSTKTIKTATYEGKSNAAAVMFMFMYGELHFSAGRNNLLVEIPRGLKTLYHMPS